MAIDVKTPKGYRKSRNGTPREAFMPASEVAARLRDQVRKSRLSYSERFEEDAERFYKLTGYLAPGRSVPAAMASVGNDEERHVAWDEWCKLEREDWQRLCERAAALLEAK